MPKIFSLLLSLTIMTGCAASSQAPLQAIDRPVDLERFMGDWYVIASIPVTIPFFSEAGAHNAVESYRLAGEGRIETTYTFRRDSFTGPVKRMTPTGFVHDTDTNAEWRMQFLWPFRAAYLIAYLDPDYQTTIVGEPKRRFVWVMSRTPEVAADTWASLRNQVEALGYDVAKLQRVPQQWPEDPQAPAR
jgi:apolipoprotein D and lipocalin family protein